MKVSLIYQPRQGVAALLVGPTAGPRLPLPLAASSVGESTAQDFWLEIKFVLSAAFASQVPGDAAGVPCTATAPFVLRSHPARQRAVPY